MSAAERKRPISGIGRYKVGSAARLTGLSTHLIRAWERRYKVVVPQRTVAGTRLYSDEDVARLQLVKALVDLGEPVSRVAILPGEELQERLAARGSESRHPVLEHRSPARLALLSPSLSAQIRSNPTALGGIEVVVDETDFDAYLDQLGASDPDLLVIALDALGADPVTAIARVREQAPEATVFCVHGFAPRRLLAEIGDRGVRLARAPLRISLLRRMVLDFRDIRHAHALRESVESFPGPVALLDEPNSPRFSDSALAELLEVRSSVACECPSQLAQLVQELSAFERYSQRCADEQPRDTELHQLLARGTGNARSLIEELLVRVCEHDGIAVEMLQPDIPERESD